MSRLISSDDMSADQIVQCGLDAMAIVNLCSFAANKGHMDGELSDDVAIALGFASELIMRLHEAVEGHEGLTKRRLP